MAWLAGSHQTVGNNRRSLLISAETRARTLIKALLLHALPDQHADCLNKTQFIEVVNHHCNVLRRTHTLARPLSAAVSKTRMAALASESVRAAPCFLAEQTTTGTSRVVAIYRHRAPDRYAVDRSAGSTFRTIPKLSWPIYQIIITLDE